jgi:hypothetical protein
MHLAGKNALSLALDKSIRLDACRLVCSIAQAMLLFGLTRRIKSFGHERQQLPWIDRVQLAGQ